MRIGGADSERILKGDEEAIQNWGWTFIDACDASW